MEAFPQAGQDEAPCPAPGDIRQVVCGHEETCRVLDIDRPGWPLCIIT